MPRVIEVYLHRELLKIIPLIQEEISIGRGDDNYVILPHPKISRRHGRFRILGEKVFYRDDSKNGSYINGRQMTEPESELGHGDAVEMSDFKLILNEHSSKRDNQKTDLVESHHTIENEKFSIALMNSGHFIERIPFEKDKISIGKSKSNTVIIKNTESQDHAMTFILMQDGVYLNLDVPGGIVRLNGERIYLGIHKINLYDQVSYYEMRLILEPRTEKSLLVGNSDSMYKLRQNVFNAATKLKNFSVLITGETGTGKELVAQSIHKFSDRNIAPFVAVNCSAISENLAESLLFGHVRGAFTGAVQNHDGYFRSAEGGTLFLDEVGDLSPATQVKVLRAIEYQEIYPVGGAVQKINVRVLAGTNKRISSSDVRSQIGFRDDLFYRLSGFQIEIPPLRERLEDVEDLVRHFHSELKLRDKSFRRVTIRKDTIEIAKKYTWPGNVRELRHATQKAIMLASDQVLNLLPDLCTELSQKILTMLSMGKSQSEIMEELQISRATYFRHK